MKFHLTKITKNPKDKEDVMLYTGENGKTVQFQASKEVFTFLFYPSSTASKRMQHKVVEKFLENGLNRNQFGGFEKAIQTLEV